MKILVPVDGSKYSVEALKTAVNLAEKFNGSIVLTNVQKRVVSRPKSMEFDVEEFIEDDPDTLRDRGRKLLDKIAEQMEGSSFKVEKCLLVGDPAEKILECAEDHKPDMIVIGSLGLTGVRKFLVGSVSSKVVSHSPFPVLVVKTKK